MSEPTETERRLPIAQALAAWAAAASTAGASLPGYVAEEIIALCREHDEQKEAGWLEPAPLPTQEALWRAVGAAVRRCREDHIESCWSVFPDQKTYSYAPMPRGLEIEVSPSGTLGVIWRTERHDISLLFWAGGVASQPTLRPSCDDEAVVVVECRHEADGECERVAALPPQGAVYQEWT